MSSEQSRSCCSDVLSQSKASKVKKGPLEEIQQQNPTQLALALFIKIKEQILDLGIFTDIKDHQIKEGSVCFH